MNSRTFLFVALACVLSNSAFAITWNKSVSPDVAGLCQASGGGMEVDFGQIYLGGIYYDMTTLNPGASWPGTDQFIPVPPSVTMPVVQNQFNQLITGYCANNGFTGTVTATLSSTLICETSTVIGWSVSYDQPFDCTTLAPTPAAAVAVSF
jgi:hypothetical protein